MSDGCGSALEGVNLSGTFALGSSAPQDWEAGRVVMSVFLWSQEILGQGVETEITLIDLLLCARLRTRYLNMLSQLITLAVNL